MLSSQLRPQSYDAPFHPLDSPLCYISLTKWPETKWKEAEGEREREREEQPRVRLEIASSLTAINCQNVPHNSARANEQPDGGEHPRGFQTRV